MKNLRNVIAEVSKHKRVRATLLETAGGLCTVRLGNNGRVLHGVPFSGGPANPGDEVNVDYSSGNPIVLARGQAITKEPEPKRIVPRPPAAEPAPPLGLSIQRYVSGKLAAVYEPNEEGMNSALSESASGHLILLPAIELTMDFTVPQGVTVTGNSRVTSNIFGTITLSRSAALDKLHILDHGEDGAEAVAVVVTGDARVNDVDAWACSCEGGAATGIKVESGKLTAANSSISGESEGGLGYGINAITGSATATNSMIYGSTDRFNGTVYVYNHVLGNPVCDCEPIWSGSLWNYYGWGDEAVQIVTPGQGGVTLGDATKLTEIARVECNWWFPSGLGMTGKYAFVDDYGVVHRVALDGSGTQIMRAQDWSSDDGPYNSSMVVLNDDECVLFYYVEEGEEDDLVMMRLNFATNERTEIHRTKAYPRTMFGEPVDLEMLNFVTRARYGDADKVVGLACYEATYPSEKGWLAVLVVIYDLTTGEVTELEPQMMTGGNDWGASIELSYFVQCPRFYQNHIVYHLPLKVYWSQVDITAGNPFPVIDIDFVANSFHIEDQWIRDPAVQEPAFVGGIDPATGIYYFCNAFWVSNSMEEYHALMSYNPAGQELDWVKSDLHMFNITQGPNTLFGIRGDYTDIWNDGDIITIPDLHVVSNNSIQMYGHTVPDETNEVIWTSEENPFDDLVPSKLKGVSYKTGEVIKAIDLIYTTDFYKYELNQRFQIVGMLNGYLVMLASSYHRVELGDGIEQYDIIILKGSAV